MPLLVSVTACAELVEPTFWLPKLTSVGFRLTRGAAVAPAPLSATDWGLSVAKSVKVRVALRAPRAPGVKVTLIVQELPAASVTAAAGAGVGLREVRRVGPGDRNVLILNAD